MRNLCQLSTIMLQRNLCTVIAIPPTLTTTLGPFLQSIKLLPLIVALLAIGVHFFLAKLVYTIFELLCMYPDSDTPPSQTTGLYTRRKGGPGAPPQLCDDAD